MRLKYFIILILVSSVLYAQTGARYLIVTPDIFYNTLQPLIEWKYKKGMKPAVYKTSEIGGADSITVRNFIKNCYDTWDVKPEFVVLVGHPGVIPMCYYQYGGSHYYTDNYYSNMDTDIYNEIIPGRISVADTNQLKVVINKIFAYERHPLTSDSLWFRKGCAIARCHWDEDSIIYLSDMRYAESLAVHNGFVHVDTFSDKCANASSVISAINEGRSFVQYRGNASTHWYDPFNVNPHSTSNGKKLPIIISATCRTVSPNASPILGENFLRTGTTSNLRGAVGFYGGTRNTGNAAHLRSAVARGFLDAIFIEGKRTFGEAGEGGRCRVYQQWGELREYNNFTCLGDPELNLWTDTPGSLLVQYPKFVPVGNAHFQVDVSEASGSIPISNAFVCISAKADSSIYVLDTTDMNGIAEFDIAPQIVEDTIFVTVTGKNLRPYEGYMIVRIIDYCYIIYLRSTVDDSAMGNDDGYINPTENIELPLWVENIGESTGVNIIGTLRSNDAYISITDSTKNFGDIPGRDSAFTSEDGYNFTVVHSCPNRHHINFDLICKDINDSTWVSSFAQMVYAPELLFDGVRVNGGNGNNIVDPGETLEVVVTLGNQGDAPADSVNAILYCQEFDIDIIDSLGWFGHIGIDSLADNGLDPFVIAVGPNMSIGTVINFTMPVFSNYCNDTFNFYLVVGKKNYFIWNPDPSPKPGENIDSILTNLGYNGDYDTDLTAQLAIYQALFVCLGVYSNRHLIPQGSAEAIAITDFLNSGGRVYLEGSSVWYVDPTYYNGHDFGPMFGIQSNEFSYGDLGPVAGQTGTFTNGMYFNYGGENAYMDHINPIGTGFLILRDNNDYFNCGVAYDAGTYRTVGTSFELGLLVDGTPPSTRAALLDSIMHFFGIIACVAEQNTNSQMAADVFEVCPNPCTGQLKISYSIKCRGRRTVALKIYDAAGRLVKNFTQLTPDALQPMFLTWYGDDNFGRNVSAGMYFVKLEYDNFSQVKKVILLK
jgi:hypothetical protein